MKHRARFEKRGALAIASAFWGLMFDAPEPEAVAVKDGIAVVDITGPLTHHAEWFWDSYDAIRERAIEAFDSSAQVVILKLDSPGGDVSGCFELARELRTMADQSAKQLIAYVDGTAASAAYALACAADMIVTPQTGAVGSVGVMASLLDETARDKELGFRVAVITSGRRKADGCSHVPLTEETIGALQAHVDELAGVFFAWVSERRGLPLQSVEGFEAGVFHGQAAVKAGLADRVMSFAELLAALTSNTKALEGKESGQMTYEELMSALKSMSEGEGDDADKAKTALKKMEDEEPPAKEPDGDEPTSEEHSEPDGDEDKEKSAKASDAVLKLAAQVQTMSAKLKSFEEREERERLIASRPDLTKDVKAWLQGESIETIKRALKTLPRVSESNPAAATTPTATRASNQDSRADRLPPEEAKALDRAMGLAPAESPIRHEGTSLVLGAITPEQAKAELARRSGGAK